jgi:NADPH:quinone reductase-like Zn-dependent oxidoreductase
MRITGGEGVDVAIDAVGPSSFRKSYRTLRQGGRLVMYGASEIQTGETRDLRAVIKGLARMPAATMPWWKSMGMMSENKGIFGLNMLSWWDREKSLDRALEPLREGLEKGELVPVVSESFPFDRAADAHRFISERRNVGKVVLVP